MVIILDFPKIGEIYINFHNLKFGMKNLKSGIILLFKNYNRNCNKICQNITKMLQNHYICITFDNSIDFFWD